MKTLKIEIPSEMKTLNIEIPSGHEIDQEQSNLSEGKIVFREVKKALPKKYRDLKPSEFNISTEIKDAQVAMEMLFLLREVYRQGWKPNWDDSNDKYVIYFHDNKIDKNSFQWTCQFLSFQSAEIRDEFLKNFRDLIETAKPLMS